ncbi:SUMF1/EgtB/PvdO family nonheme iron enzyme [bacterium]|nr:SUMF1/EgtB/PvdO family nonheme iron enzyme [bacterium]
MKKLILLIVLIIGLIGCSAEYDASKSVEFIDTGVDSEAWAMIPAGSFLKGQHAHETLIHYDYEIMITDVTNAQFVRFLNEALADSSIKLDSDTLLVHYNGEPFENGRHEFEFGPGAQRVMNLGEDGSRIYYDGKKFSVVGGFENHPVVMVTWFAANAYAQYYGWRLPTENEWEKAARGDDNRNYPWGNEIHRNQANYISSHTLFDRLFGHYAITTPVGFYNGRTYDGYETLDQKSPYGLYDMAGNVWQWMGDDKHQTHLRYMRGGCQANYEYNLRIWSDNNAGPDHYGINIGFRCVRGDMSHGEHVGHHH